MRENIDNIPNQDITSIVIRPIEEKDNIALATLIRAVFHEYDAPKINSVYDDPSTDQLYQLFMSLNAEYWVAEVDGMVVGGCGFYPTEGLPDLCAEDALLFTDALSPGRLKAYQDWLLQRGASWDTVSTYLRRLQMAYNRIVPIGAEGHNPKLFADVYTKVEPKTKRALPEELRPVLAYFLLMFYFRGMPFIDLAYLRKRDVRNGLIIYCRYITIS